MDELIHVLEFLQNGDRVALRTGNMYTIYRVCHDEVTGETSLEHDGLATLTGAYNTLRRTPSAGTNDG